MHEFKSAPVTGIVVDDDGNGIITALVSVTGIVDNVKDIIEPGSYKRTLVLRKPKGIWHHTWTDPISKTLHSEELYPGDKRLPRELPDGKPWPKEAGALLIKMQFNLETDRGRRAYSDVKFFGPEQEWSIGYNVPAGGSHKDSKTGIRHITDIDLFEYSPVLFGAMPAARTMEGVKVAQLAFKDAMGIDYTELQQRLVEWEAAMGTKDVTVGETPAEQKPSGSTFVGDEAEDVVDDDNDFADEDGLDEYSTDDFDDDEDGGDEDEDKGLNPATLRKAIDSLAELLAELNGGEDREPPSEDSTDEKRVPVAYVEAKAMEYLTLTEAIDALSFDVPPTLAAAAILFDDATEAENEKAMEKSGTAIMDLLEQLTASVGDEKADELPIIAQVMADMFSFPAKLSDEKGAPFRYSSTDYKMAPIAARQVGWPVLVGGGTESRKSKQQAFLSALDDEDLIDLADYLEESKSDRAMLRFANGLMDNRRDMDTKSAAADDPSTPKEMFDIDALKALGLDVSVK